MRVVDVPERIQDLVRKPERVNKGAAFDEISRLIIADSNKIKAYYHDVPNATKTPRNGQIVINTTYGAGFSALIRVSGIENQRLRDLLHMEKAPLNSDEETLLRCAAVLPVRVMEKYRDLARNLLDPLWLDETEVPSPRAVLQYAFQALNGVQKKNLKAQMSSDPETTGVVRCLNSLYVRIPLDQICYTSKVIFGISPHYFLRLESDIHLYTDSDVIEEFFDYYTLLPEFWKRILLKSICEGGDVS